MPKVEAWELKNKLFEKKVIAAEKEVAKKCSSKEANAIKDKMKVNRKAAYDKEDKLSDTIPAAIKKGITGKGWKDFLVDSEFEKALKGWQDALEEQQNLVKSLEDLSADAKKRFPEIKRARDEFISEMKKAGETEKTNKIIKKTLDRSATLLAELETSKAAFGTLKAKEAFFGANLKKSRDVVVTKALKDGKGDDLPDVLLENAKRQQADNTSKRLLRNVQKYTSLTFTLCAKDKFATIPTDVKAKKQLVADVKTAQSSLKQASAHLKKLQELNKGLQAAKKKQAKLIAAHNEKGKMLGLISDVAVLNKTAEDIYDAAEDLTEEADSAL